MLIQFVFLFVLAAVFVVTWRRAAQHVIAGREALAWSVLWVAAAIVIVLPDTTNMLARLLGVGRGVDAVLYGAVVLLFILAFRTVLAVDRLERTLTGLVRRDALRNASDKTNHE